jgi:hypothetical protein
VCAALGAVAVRAALGTVAVRAALGTVAVRAAGTLDPRAGGARQRSGSARPTAILAAPWR